MITITIDVEQDRAIQGEDDFQPLTREQAAEALDRCFAAERERMADQHLHGTSGEYNARN